MKAHSAAFPDMNRQQRQAQAQQQWKNLKDDAASVERQITLWLSRTEKKKAAGSIVSFFAKVFSGFFELFEPSSFRQHRHRSEDKNLTRPLTQRVRQNRR